MQNQVLYNPTPKKGGLLAKVAPKHEHNFYVDPLSSLPMGGIIVQELGDIVGTLFMLHSL